MEFGGPGDLKKLREVFRKFFIVFWSKSDFMVPSYDQTKKKINDYKSKDYFNVSVRTYTELISKSSSKKGPNKVVLCVFVTAVHGFVILCFHPYLRFSIESDCKKRFSRSRSVGSQPGIREHLAEVEMSRSWNEEN